MTRPLGLDDETAAIYEGASQTYRDNRPPRFQDRASALVRAAEGPVLDAGCGTGAYVEALGPEVIALDAVAAMLDHVDSPRRVRADLTALPIRPGALGGVWARNSLVHLPPAAVGTALAELHRALPVGAPVTASFLGGEDRAFEADDDLPGRHFWCHSDTTLVDLFSGAGFGDVQLSGDRPRFVDAVRARTLPDTVAPGLRALVCGLNPSLHAADAGVGFVTPSNRFWPAAIAAGLVSVPRDPWHALRHHGVGMTDLVKRATRRADELRAEEYRDGLGRLERLCVRTTPDVVIVVGLSGWRVAVDRTAVEGFQDRDLGGSPVYVLGSTSGLNAHSRPADVEAHLRAALAGP